MTTDMILEETTKSHYHDHTINSDSYTNCCTFSVKKVKLLRSSKLLGLVLICASDQLFTILPKVLLHPTGSKTGSKTELSEK